MWKNFLHKVLISPK